MTKEAKSVLEAALALSEPERVAVAEELLQSLGGKTQAEIDEAWVAEAERRLEAYRQGKIRSYSAEIRNTGLSELITSDDDRIIEKVRL
jgi:putative addiction module component (TIGR02574 family)